MSQSNEEIRALTLDEVEVVSGGAAKIEGGGIRVQVDNGIFGINIGGVFQLNIRPGTGDVSGYIGNLWAGHT